MPKSDPRPEANIIDFSNPKIRGIYPLNDSLTLFMQEVSDYELLRPHEISSLSTDSEATFGQIRTWLRSCKSHQACIAGPGFPRRTAEVLPTRLLELALGNDHPSVRLVHTTQMDSTDIPYATLSHCWGGTLVVKLLKSLVQDYSSSIPWQSLSQTFKDAINTAVKLDIHYLWIDALCIIQDDDDDWTYEAARMAGVYSNSYLNISADASKNGTEGLFRRRNPTKLRSFIVPHQKDNLQRCGSVFYTDRWWLSVHQSPLADRAWTVQEKFLAPRSLHFAKEEVHWECMELSTAESLPMILNAVPDMSSLPLKSSWRRDAPALQRRRAVYHAWYRLILAYSSGTLTFTSDRPTAIAGLAWVFCQLLGLSASDYLSGLWRPRLVHDLMWIGIAGWSSQPKDLRVGNLPTWSWLSLCRTVCIPPRDYEDNSDEDKWATAEVIQAFTVPGHDAFGSVSSGRVTLRVPLCQVTMWKGNRASHEEGKYHDHVMDVGGSILHEGEHFIVFPDDNTGIGALQLLNKTVYLMLGRAGHSPKSGEKCSKASLLDGQSYECLILQASVQVGYFKRLGYVHFQSVALEGSYVPLDQEDRLSPHAHAVLYNHFVKGVIPESVCGRPDDEHLYTITLI